MKKKLEKIREMANKEPVSAETLREVIALNEKFIQGWDNDFDGDPELRAMFIESNEALKQRLRKMTH